MRLGRLSVDGKGFAGGGSSGFTPRLVSRDGASGYFLIFSPTP